jgi:hypothetical protein
MTRAEAQMILLRFRSLELDGDDPEIQEALAFCKTDPELQTWAEHRARFNHNAQAALRGLAVPEELGKQIISRGAADRLGGPRRERSHHRSNVVRPSAFQRHRAILALAASLVLLLGGALFWVNRPVPSSEDRTFTGFEGRMLRFALREYRMDVLTNDQQVVRKYLTDHGAPADFPLPASLNARPVKGGASLAWQNHPVAMLCFEAPATSDTLYLFVTDQPAVPNSPAGPPRFGKFNQLSTAEWTTAGKVFVLAGHVDLPLLKTLVL